MNTSSQMEFPLGSAAPSVSQFITLSASVCHPSLTPFSPFSLPLTLSLSPPLFLSVCIPLSVPLHLLEISEATLNLFVSLSLSLHPPILFLISLCIFLFSLCAPPLIQSLSLCNPVTLTLCMYVSVPFFYYFFSLSLFLSSLSVCL